MLSLDNNTKAFFELVGAGLWEREARLSPHGEVDYNEIMRLAEEQSVVGLVTAGLEQVSDVTVPKEILLQFIGSTLQIEQQNKAMNKFVAQIISLFRKNDVYAILVKGQGIAQCYEKPLWRASGDVDLLLSDNNYEKAKKYLIPLAESAEKESGRHLGLNIETWVVELHGDQYCGLSSRIDRMINEVQRDIFYSGNVRYWMNGTTHVFLPSADNDAIILFTHFLKHFYKGGLGIRQICDWCRLLWTFREVVNVRLLEQRLHSSELMSEWKAFATFAVEYLGMPIEAMPFYSGNKRLIHKACRICEFIMETGNFGQNRKSNFSRYPFIIKKLFSMKQRICDLFRHAIIFPVDSIRFLPRIIYNGLRGAANGIG